MAESHLNVFLPSRKGINKTSIYALNCIDTRWTSSLATSRQPDPSLRRSDSAGTMSSSTSSPQASDSGQCPRLIDDHHC